METSAPSKWRSRMPQILANIAANLLILDLCMAIAFTTVLIAATFNTHDDLSIDEYQASWLGSIAFICQPIGSLMSGVIVEFFGRKWSMIVVNLPFLLGWLLYSFANSIDMLFTANIILGVGIGFMEAPIMTYLGETCQPQVRALITSFPGITCQLSVFVVYLMGNVVYWKTAAGINAALPVLTILYVLLMPETPIWLLSRGRYNEAEKALCWLRGWVSPEVIKEEFNQLVIYSNTVNKTNFPSYSMNPVTATHTHSFRLRVTNGYTANPEKDNQTPHPVRATNDNTRVSNDIDEEGGAHCSFDRWKEMLKPETRRPLAVILPSFFLLHWGGMSSIRPYMVHVFEEFGLGESSSWNT
ncbi:hypothetical protein L9F63_004772, partial [Diploptera punctata]